MNFKQNMQKAMLMFQNDNISEAKKILLKLIKKFPKEENLYGNLALIYIREKSAIQAEQMFKQSLKINPHNYEILKNFIHFLFQKKNWDQLIEIYIAYKNITDKHEIKFIIEMYYAVALRETGKLDNALVVFENLLEINPNNESLLLAYGYTLNKTRKYIEAVEIYKKGINLARNNLALNYNMGITYANLREYEESNKFLNIAATINPNVFDLWITMAGNYVNLNKIEQAYECIEKCKLIDSSNPLINYQLGIISSHTGDHKKSLFYLTKLIEQNPGHIEANYFLGILHLELGNFKKAIKHYRYRTIREKDKFGMFDDFNLPEINLDDELLIGKEQGIGDQLLFLRLIDEISSKVKSITYISEPRLEKIISKENPKITVILDHEYKNNKQKYEKYKKINLASIIHYVDDVYNSLELKNENYKTKKIITRSVKRIGVSWKSKADRDGFEKSIRLEDLIEILQINNCEFINLQYGDVEEEINNLMQKHHIRINYDRDIDYTNDFERLSELIKSCDEIITTSNFTAHLAGTLNIETNLLLPKTIGRKWYWYDNDDKYSIWYGKIKKFIQKTDGIWKDPILELADDLKNKFKTN